MFTSQYKQDEYIQNRVLEQIQYYSKKSKKYKKISILLTTSNIVVTALIPVIAMSFGTEAIYSKIIISIMGAFSSISIGINLFGRFNEIQLQYRATCERLKSELLKYQNGVEDYSAEGETTAFQRFVPKCEEIMLSEHHKWADIRSKSN